MAAEKTRASEDCLGDLHRILAEELTKRIREGTATAADLNAARQFLKDNGIDAIPTAAPLRALTDALPSYEAEEYQGRDAVSQ